MSDLLGILRKSHPDLPKYPRTLLKTKINYTILNKCGGEYYYFGIVSSIYQEIRQSLHLIQDQYTLKLQIHIDGLPLFKALLTNYGQYWGKSKTLKATTKFSLFAFLTEQTNQIILKNIERNGIEFSGKQLNVTIDSIICDAPARAFIKSVKSYYGYHGCGKCTQRGR